MADPNLVLRDAGISHAIGIRRLSTDVVKKVVDLLDKTDVDLVTKIQALPADVSQYTRWRMEQLLKDLRKLNKDVYKNVGSTLKTEMELLASYEAGYTAKSVAPVLGVKLGFFRIPSRAQLIAAATGEPFLGRYLSEWVDGLELGRFTRLRDAIRFAVVSGATIAEIIKTIRGTKALDYKDGILEISRRSAEAFARTAVSHSMTAARQITMEENKDILSGWRFVATLEQRTCLVCAALDGNVYQIGEGPFPPRHPNCRCTTVGVIKTGGQVERITYAKWLAAQPVEVQDEILGPTRARLYRAGKLKIDRFTDDERTLTLEQLKQIEPEAFKEARIGTPLVAHAVGAGAPSKDEFVYHGTAASNLDSIRENGLKPMADNSPLNVAMEQSAAEFYASPEFLSAVKQDKGPGVILRIRADALPSNTVFGAETPLRSKEAWTMGTIAPENIEILRDGEWHPLIEQS
jgi:SPP1 gp7 family putative phage head morphogenesis protein